MKKLFLALLFLSLPVSVQAGTPARSMNYGGGSLNIDNQLLANNYKVTPTGSSVPQALKDIVWPVTNGGNGYVGPDQTDVEIQAALDAVSESLKGQVDGYGIVRLWPGSTYAISNTVYVENNHVLLDCQGSTLDMSSLSGSDIGLWVGNFKGTTNGVYGTPGSIRNCHLKGVDSGEDTISTSTTGLLIESPNGASATLSADVTSPTQTNISISAANNHPPIPFSLKIDNEYVLVTGGMGTTTLTVERGYNGSTATTHTTGASVVNSHNSHPIVENTSITGFHYNFWIGSGAWSTFLDHVASGRGYYACYFDPITRGTPSSAGEATIAIGSTCFNSYVLYHNNASVVRWFGGSLDYFYDDGLGVNSKSRMISNTNGGTSEFINTHKEFNYGNLSGETNFPIINTGWSILNITGGEFNYTGTSRHWSNLAQGNDVSGRVTVRDQMFTSSYIPNHTEDDALYSGTDTSGHYSNIPGLVSISGVAAFGKNSAALPSCVAYERPINYLRGGANGSYDELLNKSVVTGTLAIARQSGSDGIVVPKSASNMTKITGSGKWIITLPAFAPNIHVWSFFLNAAEASGTITISEQYTTGHPVWNGSTSISFNQDAKNKTSTPYSLPTVGQNVWSRVSWKDMGIDFPISFYPEYVAIIIDTTGMTGTLYLDMACAGSI